LSVKLVEDNLNINCVSVCFVMQEGAE